VDGQKEKPRSFPDPLGKGNRVPFGLTRPMCCLGCEGEEEEEPKNTTKKETYTGEKGRMTGQKEKETHMVVHSSYGRGGNVYVVKHVLGKKGKKGGSPGSPAGNRAAPSGKKTSGFREWPGYKDGPGGKKRKIFRLVRKYLQSNQKKNRTKGKGGVWVSKGGGELTHRGLTFLDSRAKEFGGQSSRVQNMIVEASP